MAVSSTSLHLQRLENMTVEKLQQNFEANNVTAAEEKTNYILQQFTIG